MYNVRNISHLVWIRRENSGKQQRFTNTLLFTPKVINWQTVVVWIIVMFLSAVWTLILTAPIHCRGSIGEQEM